MITDILMFLVVVSLAVSRTLKGFRMSHVLQTIVQDTTLYFLMIFTCHVVFEISLLLVRVSTPVLHGGGMLRNTSSQACDFYRDCEHSVGRF